MDLLKIFDVKEYEVFELEAERMLDEDFRFYRIVDNNLEVRGVYDTNSWYEFNDLNIDDIREANFKRITEQNI